MIKNEPVWIQDIKNRRKYPSLKENLVTEVVIIGGGITGVNCLYLLTEAGIKAVLVEKDQLGEGATEYTTAFVTQVIDTELTTLQATLGTKRAKLVWESGQEAINFFDKTVKKEKIDCQFKSCTSYLYASTQGETGDLEKEGRLAKELGFKVELQTTNKLPFINYGYLEIKDQAKFQPLKYLFKLADIASKRGGVIFEKTEALTIEDKNNQVIVKTNQAQITAKYGIIATYAPFSESILFKLKKAMYKTYVLDVQITKDFLPEATFEDMQSPYHYFRVDKGKNFDRLIIGGEDHRNDLKINETKCFKALENYLKTILSGTSYKIIRSWTGGILEPTDGLPFIGDLITSNKIFYATAFSGNGMTYSAVAARILTDKILGRENPYAGLYSAKRIPNLNLLAHKALDYTRIFFGSAVKNTIWGG